MGQFAGLTVCGLVGCGVGCGSPEPMGSGASAAGSTSIGGANAGGASATTGGADMGVGGAPGIGGGVGSGGVIGSGGSGTGGSGVGGAGVGGAGVGGAGVGGAGVGGAGVGGAGVGGSGVGGDPATGGTGGGESTCVAGVDTGDACDPAVDTEVCERSTRTCVCGADSLWTCTPTGGSGGTGTGGEPGSGGTGTGGDDGTGGTGTGGDDGTGGEGTGGGDTIDCDAPMPSGGTPHCGSNTQGTAGGLSWSLWSNNLNSNSCITTYDATAFSASWVESGDFLARIGLEWGGGAQPYTSYGTLMAQFSYNKTGTGGGFSYIGMYGWTNNPCVEYYIVEDSWNNFPFNPWQATQTGSGTIDGEEYRFYRNQTNGTGGSRCSGVTTWDQFWSVRQSARQCGTISLTEHFDAWTAAGMQLGNMLEAKILVEVGGGSGSIEFPVANVVAE